MSKFQQEIAVLLICNVILFVELKTTWLGLVVIFLTAAFVVMMQRGAND
ncbi:hypothetical protein [Acinetobacter indicus]|nr:hypothetical protein [Acinetobacter indicus]